MPPVPDNFSQASKVYLGNINQEARGQVTEGVPGSPVFQVN